MELKKITLYELLYGAVFNITLNNLIVVLPHRKDEAWILKGLVR